MKTVTVKDIVENFEQLELLTNYNGFEKEVAVQEISRPGVELAGYFEYLTEGRVHVFGMQETSYMEHTNYDKNIIEKFMSQDIPMLIFGRDITPDKMFLDLADKNKIPVYKTKKATSKFISMLYSYLEYSLAPETQLHGVLLSVFGMGVMIRGGSGIGKSEVALELINRGHLLVADDAVVIKRTDEKTLIGSAPTLLKNRLEIRGIGIVDIQKLYGVTKVIPRKKISLIIELDHMDGTEDRIGNKSEKFDILGYDVPKIKVPISSGRSTSNLIEVAVANYELKKNHDYDSSEVFVEDLNKLLGGDISE